MLDDPMLDGVAAVLFDEFHERSLDADLGLALARDVQQGLREDLRLVAMSATIDGARVAKLLGGRAGHCRGRPRVSGRDPLSRPRCARPSSRRWPTRLFARCALIKVHCWRFFPAPRKFAAPRACLTAVSMPIRLIAELYGALSGDEQDRAIAPAPTGRRKIVLATSIAETSITIEGVRMVVDCGLVARAALRARCRRHAA